MAGFRHINLSSDATLAFLFELIGDDEMLDPVREEVRADSLSKTRPWLPSIVPFS